VKVGVKVKDAAEGEGVMRPAGVADGIKGGVGDKISGKGEGETCGVVTDKGIVMPPQDTRRKIDTVSRPLFNIFSSIIAIVAENSGKNIVVLFNDVKKTPFINKCRPGWRCACLNPFTSSHAILMHTQMATKKYG
jgi:hypothetical protein